MPSAEPIRRLPKVLIIDDDMISREVMATVLTMSGYTTHSVGNGAEAVALLRAEGCSPDVVLMDTQMPGLSGAALIQELRRCCKAKIYAMSGSDAPPEVTAGADAFLLKPIGMEALQRILEQHAPSAETGRVAEISVLSSETLAELRSLMPEDAVREIYAVLVRDLGTRTTALETAISQGNVTEVRRLGHAIKGGCGMAGATRVARLGERLEAESNQLDNSPAILRELQDAAGDLRRMLNSEFPELGD